MYHINIGEQKFEITPAKGNPAEGEVGDNSYSLDIAGADQNFNVIYKNGSYNITLEKADFDTRTFTIRVNNNDYELEAKDRFDLLLEELGMEDLAASTVNDLKAPMPGMVLNIHVKAGDEVKKGSPLLVLEAMKMENNLKAETDATVKAVHAETGKAVDKNQVLIEFEA